MWEEFPDGGCWILRIKKKSARNHLGQLWETLVMACIGRFYESLLNFRIYWECSGVTCM